MRHSPIALVAAALMAAATPALGQQRPAPARPTGDITPPNILSSDELAQGFRLLFDGVTTNGWRGYRRATMPDGWRAVNGALTRVGPAGDIVTIDEYDNFELRLEWRVPPGGNSGIMYRVSEDYAAPYHSGPEMQVLDDERHSDGRSRFTAAGSCHSVYAAPAGVVRPAGEWNAVRLIVNGAHVEHWLNGVKVVEYELWTDEWRRLVNASKFAQWPAYGMSRRGRIDLQDHDARVEYRSMRIRVLP